ncbi:hypothetical protein TL16_g03552 [Triparma laevis f. inornata]|uniref:Uncharacterized protein n=1 Tax=Triparma laevis f. inornata TaxID=1714386 RepID=A0A9W7A4I5_9STRA|nr:hypothetical protein TL16_g03552 [Triparma laevis f. inornata]
MWKTTVIIKIVFRVSYAQQNTSRLTYLPALPPPPLPKLSPTIGNPFSSMPPKPSQTLPKRESSLFKDVMHLYEKKSYKKGLKTTDQILKKHPSHGETLAMRGLILRYLDRKDEAIENIKKGLMNNMMSHVCWHVYGLVHRADRNYVEAIKCYKQALRIDKDNMQILRDLSLLQIQMRDLPGFSSTRSQIMELGPGLRFNWIAYAISCHLNNNLSTAVSVIDSFVAQVDADAMKISETERETDFCKSELQMYKNMILMEGGEEGSAEKAMEHLKEVEKEVLDVGAWLFRKGELELKMSKFSDAETSFFALLERGQTEDYRVHRGYQCALLNLPPSTSASQLSLKGMTTPISSLQSTLSSTQITAVLEKYKTTLEPLNARSNAFKRIPLSAMPPALLEENLRPYMEKMLKKGVPSLDGVPLKDPQSIKSHPNFKCISKLTTELKPSAELWGTFLEVQLSEITGDYESGLTLIDFCISKVTDDKEKGDLLERKARLLKLSGDITAAVASVDEARELDKADRYINNKTTKYLLRAGEEEKAEATIGLFTRHEANPTHNLFEMQCSWYELEYGRAMHERGDVGKALKKYVSVEKHFEDFSDDQFDFHNYCIRRMTLRAYVDILRLEDHIWDNKFYISAACGAIDCYLHLADNPLSAEDLGDPDYSKMSAAEKKKAKAAARKKKKKEEEKEAAEKAKKEEEEKKKAEEKAKKEATKEGENKEEDEEEEKEDEKKPPAEDKDPKGLELMKKDWAEECEKFASSLRLHCPQNVLAWLKSFDVYLRMDKLDEACDALAKAKELDCASFELFSRVAKLGWKVKGVNAVDPSIIEKLSALLGGASVEDFVKASAKTVGELGLTWRCAVAEAAVLTKVEDASGASKFVVNGGLESKGGHLVVNCVNATKALKRFGGDDKAWTDLCKKKFTRAKVFD